MSDQMLHAVLNMPPDLWTGDEIDVMQRSGRYRQASEMIESQQAEIEALREQLLEAGKARAELAEFRALTAEAFITCCVNKPHYYVELTYPTLKQAQDFHGWIIKTHSNYKKPAEEKSAGDFVPDVVEQAKPAHPTDALDRPCREWPSCGCTENNLLVDGMCPIPF